MSTSVHRALPFPPLATARASLKQGALYAIDGGDGFIFWKGGAAVGTTQVHDPNIQDLELIAVYDAEFHVPKRLRVEYNDSRDAWSVGASIRRERLKKQALAKKFPDSPWHQLPKEWVSVEP